MLRVLLAGAVGFPATPFDARRVKQFEAATKSLVHGFDGVLLIDGDNVRGKSLFGLSHASLLARTARWSARNKLSGNVVVLVDHGTLPSAYHLPSLASVAIAFSGPQLSADDVAARDVAWFHARGHDLMLVTADSGLAQRCRRAAANGRSLQVVPPQALLAALGYTPPPASPRGVVDDGTAGAAQELASADPDCLAAASIGEGQLQALETEMRCRAALTRADRAVIRVGSNSKKSGQLQKQRVQRRAELQAALEASDAVNAPRLADVVSDLSTECASGADGGEDGAEVAAGSRSDEDARSSKLATAPRLGIAVQDAVMSALIQRRAVRPASEQWVEHTFERVVLAEALRRRLRRRQADRTAATVELEATIGPAAAYAMYLNGELPPPQTATLAAPGRADAETATAAAAAAAAAKAAFSGANAAPFRSPPDLHKLSGGLIVDESMAADVGTVESVQLPPLVPSDDESAATFTVDEQEPASLARLALPVRRLLVRTRDASRPIEGTSARHEAGGKRGGKRGGSSRRDRQRKRRQTSFQVVSGTPPVGTRAYAQAEAAAAAAAAGAASRAAALQSDASRRDDGGGGGGGGGPVPGRLARLVVVSDTHGHEAMLTAAAPSAESAETPELRLPAGDVLVHCGDWAADPPRAADGSLPDGWDGGAAALDEWLSRQPHRSKLVVRGNHDPPDASFPRSGAVYVTSPRSLRLEDVNFGVVPYSKGPLRGGLPEGDVLVSHVPPSRLLDRTNGGEFAGDDSLRTAVRRAKDKPRLWLFGHIHEAAGAARVRLGSRSDGATTLLNAANANPGIARRLITGAVAVDLEVPPSAR